MPRIRYRHGAAAVGTDIYVFGGTDDSDAIIYHVDKFDTITETWSTLSQLMVDAYRDPAALYVSLSLSLSLSLSFSYVQ